MTVYVLVEEWMLDSGDGNVSVEVFDNFEKAQKELETRIEIAKSDFKDLDTEETTYCKGDMAYQIWQTGEYTLNHTSLVIMEKEVK